MNISTQQAQQRAEQIHVFQRELDSLENEGVVVLDAGQRQRVVEHHRNLLDQYSHRFDIDRNKQASQLSLGMRIASLFGALALSSSVFFLFYQFWGWFSTTVQVSVLIVAPLVMLSITNFVRSKDASGYFASLASMATFACFVLNITMLGQIFNLSPSDNALLPWAALAFLLAYAYDLRLLLVVGILCLIAYVAARTGTWGGMYGLSFGEHPESFFPAATLLLLIPWFIPHKSHGGFSPLIPCIWTVKRIFACVDDGELGRIKLSRLEYGFYRGLLSGDWFCRNCACNLVWGVQTAA